MMSDKQTEESSKADDNKKKEMMSDKQPEDGDNKQKERMADKQPEQPEESSKAGDIKQKETMPGKQPEESSKADNNKQKDLPTPSKDAPTVQKVQKDPPAPSKDPPAPSKDAPTVQKDPPAPSKDAPTVPKAIKTKKIWGKAMTGVRIAADLKAEADTFLERFTVTGRSFSKENTPEIYHWKDYFTLKFWMNFVVDPSGTNYYYWSMIMMCAVLYNLMVIIVRCVFWQLHDYNLVVWLTVDYLCDFLNLWDMFFKARIGFLEQGLMVRDVKRLKEKYMKSWKFYCDIISLLPFDILYVWYGFSAIFRLNRLMKTWRLVEFFHMADAHTNFPNLIRVSNLVLYIIIIIHWNGCFFFAISRAIGFGTDTWVYPDLNDPGFGGFWKQYFYSFYWSCLTLTTIGDTQQPESATETFYCILCALVGVLIFATIFGNVGAMINHMDAARTEFQVKVDNVKRYMELRCIGPELQGRVVKWFDYTWNNKQSIDDKEALQFLPEKLRAEISIHVHMQTLRRVAIFQDCEPGLLVELVGKLKLQVFSPGDFICKKGDIGKEMYIIKRGKLQVVSVDGTKVFVTLSDGAVFGEISVLNIAGNKTGNRRTACVKTLGFSDLFCLTKTDLWEALEEYPEAKKMLIEKGKQILRKDKLLDEEMARREERRQQGMIIKVEMIVDAVEEIQKSITGLSERLDRFDKTKPTKSLTSIDVTPILSTGDKPERAMSASRMNKTPSPIPEEDEKQTVKKT